MKYLLQGESELHTYIHRLLHTHTHTSFKGFLHNILKMSYARLLLELSEDRQSFVLKVYSEMYNNALVKSDGKIEGIIFFH